MHRIEVEPGSRLQDILSEVTISVNSFHHQAVSRVGDGLAVSARCDADGVIEGLELPEGRFVVGVQWHPETFWDHSDSFQSLFNAQAEACRNGAGSPGVSRS